MTRNRTTAQLSNSSSDAGGQAPRRGARRSVRTGAATVLVGALMLAGCGSEDSSQPATRGSNGERLTVTETDFELDPAKGRVGSSGGISIKVVNAGKTVHALALDTGGETQSTGKLEPGKTAMLNADLEPGRYTWYCPVANHRELGMTGTLTVGAKATEPESSAPDAPGGGYGY